MGKYIIEGIGTFFLVLVIALTGNPLAIGAILIAMIYMGGYISGGHYNPAVTLAVYLRGKIDKEDAIRYVIAQIVAGLIAAIVFEIIKETTFVPAPATDVTLFTIILVEMIFTFALASVVLHVATSDKVKGNYYYGLAIGLTVLAAAFAGGPISGGVFNPAVAIGPMLIDMDNIVANLPHLIAYIVGPCVGAGLAAMVYKYIGAHK